MLFLVVLVVGIGGAWLLGRHRGTWRDHARRGLGVAMVVAGASHLLRPEPFEQHLPDWVPLLEVVVAVTGIIEIVFGLLLFRPVRYRLQVGRALALYFVAVFPANVYVAVEGIDVDGQPGGPYPWIRLPLQALFVLLAWWSTRTEHAEVAQASDAYIPEYVRN
jgi:uncharacterized membrane protein